MPAQQFAGFVAYVPRRHAGLPIPLHRATTIVQFALAAHRQCLTGAQQPLSVVQALAGMQVKPLLANHLALRVVETVSIHRQHLGADFTAAVGNVARGLQG